MIRMILLCLVLVPVAAGAYEMVPVTGGTAAVVNAGPGNQNSPRIDGNLVVYGNQTASGSEIRYFDFATGADLAIPVGAFGYDTNSSVSGTSAVFVRVEGSQVFSIWHFDVATGGPAVELAPVAGSERINPSIGGTTVAWKDQTFSTGSESTGDLVIRSEIVTHDLASGVTLRLTDDLLMDRVPAVAPSGDVIVWEKCTTNTTPCDIWQATRTGGTWSVSQVTSTPDREAWADTNGSLVVYEGDRAGIPTGRDIYWKPVSGGAETQLALEGEQTLPRLSGNVMCFQWRNVTDPTPNWDVHVLDLSTSTIYRLTDTPVLDEQSCDISVVGTRARVVWSVLDADETNTNVRGTTFELRYPPVANAGPDQSAYTRDAITLAGAATDANGDAITTWEWTVLDAPAGSTWTLAGAATPVATFEPQVPGDYVLSLAVIDATGQASAGDIAIVHAVENLPPVAIAVADTASGLAPLTVCFDGSQSTDPEGAPTSHAWQFGDGIAASTSTACHTYALPGTYDVTFRVTDVRGASDVDMLVVNVLPPANAPPVTTPTATPATGAAPLAVQFTANASDPDAGSVITYDWNFGDGGASDLANPGHTYAAPGTYVAWLTVSDGLAAASASITISVSPTMEFNVTKAEIDFKSRRSSLAKVELRAELYAPEPGPDDILALYLDGALVFATRFGQFAPAQDHGRDLPGVYKFKAKDLWVRIDFVAGRLTVDADKALLTGFDPRNGVDVEVLVGNATAVDNISTEDEGGQRHHRHHRPERGRGHESR